ncbi:beta-glucan synthesis-associated protein KRE6 [Crepidotus variabilis]|uniref:Beta-glucan synthesis-associated protein KRE6 n=1 Tax=Crepidotus variabilis TaxID=179855 RepID=A0A9P6E9M6_9AGAR|nr:beta-glucan synthesis-associated protein KRE6 [Crepidotus variabilis]
MNHKEPDDFLHNPDPRRDRKNDHGGSIFTVRGLANLGCLSILALGCLMLFAGYPMLTHFLEKTPSAQGGFNLGGINATGQISDIPGNFGLIDKDTPQEALTYKSYQDDEELVLVFSDEFNQDDRTFYPGDDPFWEAVDLHYWGTNNLEWYDPIQVTTKNGKLQLRMEIVDNEADNHNLKYRSAMLQTWNKFCFTGGLILVNLQLPGVSNIGGLWPAFWTMGNLGRAGFGASVEGLWPYTYDSCDVGTLPNQTYPDGQRPLAAITSGDQGIGGSLSYLPGQRLSACTCPGESHPGPMRKDGTYVGRSAPEIDVVEATIIDDIGYASMSSQFAPFNAGYKYDTTQTQIFNTTRTQYNTYLGGIYQQTASCIVLTDTDCYETPGKCFAQYGFEYKPGFDGAYITWINQEKAWTVLGEAFEADSTTEVGRRPVPMEPMYLITNLGMAHNFGVISDQIDTVFPATMQIDWVRIYQRKDSVNVGCDPKDFPTAQYIETYKDAYTNPNFTVWADTKQPWPKNRLTTGSC